MKEESKGREEGMGVGKDRNPSPALFPALPPDGVVLGLDGGTTSTVCIAMALPSRHSPPPDLHPPILARAVSGCSNHNSVGGTSYLLSLSLSPLLLPWFNFSFNSSRIFFFVFPIPILLFHHSLSCVVDLVKKRDDRRCHVYFPFF